MPTPHVRTLLRLGFTALCVSVAGCGGDDGPSDADKIATVTKLAATSKHVKATCETAVTARFVREIYGSARKCRAENKPDPKDTTVEGASVSGTRIAGAKATTALKVTSDGTTVAEGLVALVKEGANWKLDRFGPVILRSVLRGVPKLQGFPKGTEACVARATRGLSDAAVLRAATALLGGRFEDLPVTVNQCLIGNTLGRSALEQGVTEALKEQGGYSKARVACITRRLRTAISDAQIASLTSSKLPPAIERKLTRAILQC